MKSLFILLIALVLAGCTVSHYYHHRQQAPRKYRRYYQHNQRKNSRHRDTESYARAAWKGKYPLVWVFDSAKVKTKEVR